MTRIYGIAQKTVFNIILKYKGIESNNKYLYAYICIYISINESLCYSCPADTNTILQINYTQFKKYQTWLGLWETFHSAMVTHWIKAAQRRITFHFSVPGYYRKQPICSWIVRQIVNFVSLKRRPKNRCSCL